MINPPCLGPFYQKNKSGGGGKVSFSHTFLTSLEINMILRGCGEVFGFFVSRAFFIYFCFCGGEVGKVDIDGYIALVWLSLSPPPVHGFIGLCKASIRSIGGCVCNLVL